MTFINLFKNINTAVYVNFIERFVINQVFINGTYYTEQTIEGEIKKRYKVHNVRFENKRNERDTEFVHRRSANVSFLPFSRFSSSRGIITAATNNIIKPSPSKIDTAISCLFNVQLLND